MDCADAFMSVPRSDVPSYESFAGALAAQFDVVEMATQSAAQTVTVVP